MIDKLLLNNQIVTNKKKIIQARAQTINKLVQKLRKLKQLHEKIPQNAKITKNLEKSLQILSCVKKFKGSEIVRKILTLNKSPSSILTNGQAKPDEVALALLAGNKIIIAIIENLKNLLSLNDSNPGWQSEILEVSKRQQKATKSVEKKKTKKIVKKQPKIPVKSLPWKEENLDVSENENCNKIGEETTSGWKVEPISEKNALPALPKTTATERGVSNSNSTDSYQITKDHLKEPNDAKPVTTVDPFFFTETGDNYLSTVVIDRVQPEAVQDGLIRRERRDHTLRPNKKNNVFRKQFGRSEHVPQNGRIEKNYGHVVKPSPAPIDEKLHPSWIAKQKLKPIITEFKGHKIKFDNDGNDTTVVHGKPIKLERHQDKTPATSKEDIHPSWAAKQKQKPAIQEFKGTKVVFDD